MKAEDWKEIRRDEFGFLADETMAELYKSLPIIVWDSKHEEVEYVCKDNWYDWLSDLEGKPYYSHYLPIVLPNED